MQSKKISWISLLSASLPLALLFAQVPTANSSTQTKGKLMKASGQFTVKVVPQTDSLIEPPLARMSIDKQFTGDLQATSKGQMLSAGTDVKYSAGYVAIEKVTGTLSGKAGSFILQHSGTMNRGVPQLTISVVPDSGTGELSGIAGAMQINIADGQHSYTFDYTLVP